MTKLTTATLAIVCACLLAAQTSGTGINGNQIRISPPPLAVPPTIALMARAGENFYPVTLGLGVMWRITPRGLVIDAPVPVAPQLEVVRLSAPLAALTLGADPQSGTLRIWWNGLQLTEPDDYTVAGRIVTFTVQLEAGSIVRAEYR